MSLPQADSARGRSAGPGLGYHFSTLHKSPSLQSAPGARTATFSSSPWRRRLPLLAGWRSAPYNNGRPGRDSPCRGHIVDYTQSPTTGPARRGRPSPAVRPRPRRVSIPSVAQRQHTTHRTSLPCNGSIVLQCIGPRPSGLPCCAPDSRTRHPPMNCSRTVYLPTLLPCPPSPLPRSAL